MAAPDYTYRTVIDEVRSSLDIGDTDQVIDDEVILEYVFKYINVTQSFEFQEIITGKLYTTTVSPEHMIYELRFTGESDIKYQVNASGSIRVTTGTATATSITATGSLVWYNMVIIDLLHWMATHRSIEAGVNVPMGTYTPRTAREILDMASIWQGITNE